MPFWQRRKRHAIALLAGTAILVTGALVSSAGAAGATVSATYWHNYSSASIDLTHWATQNQVDATGKVLIFYTARNTGQTTLGNVVITDPTPGVSPLTCDIRQPAVLQPGQRINCSATYDVTQSDLDNARRIVSNAKVIGTSMSWGSWGHSYWWKGGGQTVCDYSQYAIQARSLPAITLDKTADKAKASTVGEVINYTFAVKNTGNVTLRNVKVTDPKPGLSALTCTPAQPATLAPAAKLVCKGKYTVTQTDVESASGHITNTATATGTPTVGWPVTSTDTVKIPVNRTSSISLTKTADKQSVSKVGEKINYTLVATNTGNVALRDVTVEDRLPGVSALACTPAIPARLAPGAKITCTGSYNATLADLNRGQITNDGRTRGVSVADGSTVTAKASVVVKAAAPPAISLTMTADKQTVSKVGEQIKYTLVSTNTGIATLRDVTVNANLVGATPLSCTPAIPAVRDPGAKVTCTSTYTVTQVDLTRGRITNDGRTFGVSVVDGTAVTANASVVVKAAAPPAISLTMTADKQTVSQVGEQIKYTLVSTNTGIATLRDVTVNANLVGATPLSCTPAIPAVRDPGAKVTCTSTYTVTQVDLNRGQITNDGRTFGVSVVDGTAVTANASVVVKATAASSAISLTKTPDKKVAFPGNKITYTFEATNTGGSTLSNVAITDPLVGLSALTCAPQQPAALAPGAKLKCTATYTVTTNDAVAGVIVNTATVKGTDPSGKTVTGKASATVTAQLPS